MNIPMFANSINKSHQILLTKQIDLIKIITDDNPRIFDNILHCFVGIAAIQVGYYYFVCLNYFKYAVLLSLFNVYRLLHR